jgi:hypothetical protein
MEMMEPALFKISGSSPLIRNSSRSLLIRPSRLSHFTKKIVKVIPKTTLTQKRSGAIKTATTDTAERPLPLEPNQGCPLARNVCFSVSISVPREEAFNNYCRAGLNTRQWHHDSSRSSSSSSSSSSTPGSTPKRLTIDHEVPAPTLLSRKRRKALI